MFFIDNVLSLAAEKTLSEGTVVEGAHKSFLAMQENCQRSVNVCGRGSDTIFSLGSTGRCFP